MEELSQIARVARQVQSLLSWIDYNVTPDLLERPDYLAAGKQSGDCAGHLVRYSQVYTSRLLHGLGDRAQYFIAGAWWGRHRTDTRDHCPQTGKQILSLAIPSRARASTLSGNLNPLRQILLSTMAC